MTPPLPPPLNIHSGSNKKHNKQQLSIINTLSSASKQGVHLLVVIYLASALPRCGEPEGDCTFDVQSTIYPSDLL